TATPSTCQSEIANSAPVWPYDHRMGGRTEYQRNRVGFTAFSVAFLCHLVPGLILLTLSVMHYGMNKLQATQAVARPFLQLAGESGDLKRKWCVYGLTFAFLAVAVYMAAGIGNRSMLLWRWAALPHLAIVLLSAGMLALVVILRAWTNVYSALA